MSALNLHEADGAMVSGIGQFHTNEADPRKPDKNLQPYPAITWADITAMIDNPQQVPKGKAQWVIPSTLMTRCFLRQEREGQFWMLWADFDIEPQGVKAVAAALSNSDIGLSQFECYSSRSATAEKPKCRAMIPLDQPLSGGDWALAQEVLNDLLAHHNLTPDRVSQRTGQLCYLPNRGAFYETHSKRTGAMFDPLKTWAKRIEAKRQMLVAAAATLEAGREAAAGRKVARAASTGTQGRPTLIDAFNDAYTVADILLQAGYAQRGDTFCHPASESGSYSASVKDGRVHSLSSSDPLYTGGAGGGAHDPFGAFELLMHGGNRQAALMDAGDSWLNIGGEAWSTVTRREWAQQQAQARKTSPPAEQQAQEPDEQRRERQRKNAQDIGDGTAGQAPLTDIQNLPEMLNSLVFIGDGSRVALRDRPHIALPLSEFKVLTRASQTRVGKKLVPTVDLWVEDPQRISTHTITYRPGYPEFTTDPDGSDALNLWADRQRAPAVASVAPFLDHIRYLVGDVAECERFLDWLAHIEQHPGVLPHTHYLMVAQQTGIGRNWLASLLARVWAGATRLGFDLVGAMQSGFNGALSRRLLVIVDELKTADTGYGAVNHGQQLKAMLTTEHRGINPKFGRQHTEFNCARWLMLSQHYDALPLERNDRRVIVISNPSERKPADYFRRLYQLLDEPAFTGAVGHWLGQRDISGFNPSEPAPLTVAKGKAIDACIGDVERALIDLRTGTDAQVMRSTQIMEYLQDCGLRPPAGRSLSAAYAAAGMVPCARLVTWQGKKHRVVSLREGARLKDASAADLLELLVASK